MAERIVQEESLVAVADAIRAKGGTTDALSFPTGFVNAISTIQAGGGGGISAYVETVTFAENTQNYTVHHNLCVIPDVAIIVCTNNGIDVTNKFPYGLVYWYADQNKGSRCANSVPSDNYANLETEDHEKIGIGKNSNSQLTVTEETFVLAVADGTFGFAAGATYKIVICKTT
jgi:hypothetical protein